MKKKYTDIELNHMRQHLLEGLLIAKSYEKAFLNIIKHEDNPKQMLIEKFSLSSVQAKCILDLKKPINEIEEQLLANELDNLKSIELELKNT